MAKQSHFKNGEPPAMDVRGISKDAVRLRGKSKGWRRPFIVGVLLGPVGIICRCLKRALRGRH